MKIQATAVITIDSKHRDEIAGWDEAKLLRTIEEIRSIQLRCKIKGGISVKIELPEPTCLELLRAGRGGENSHS